MYIPKLTHLVWWRNVNQEVDLLGKGNEAESYIQIGTSFAPCEYFAFNVQMYGLPALVLGISYFYTSFAHCEYFAYNVQMYGLPALVPGISYFYTSFAHCEY